MNHPPILIDISKLKTCYLATPHPCQYCKIKEERVRTDGCWVQRDEDVDGEAKNSPLWSLRLTLC